MGAWGYGSFENDTALDFIHDLINWKKLKKLIKKKQFNHRDYDELRISAEIIIHLHLINKIWTEREIMDGLSRGLQQAIQDESWYESWKDESGAKDIMRQLKKFIKQLKNLDGY